MNAADKYAECLKKLPDLVVEFIEPAEGYVFVQARFSFKDEQYELSEPIASHQNDPQTARVNLIEQLHFLVCPPPPPVL